MTPTENPTDELLALLGTTRETLARCRPGGLKMGGARRFRRADVERVFAAMTGRAVLLPSG